MIRKFLLPFLASGMLLASCGNGETPVAEMNTSAATPPESDMPVNDASNMLVNNTAKPAEVQFARENFEGLGTIELPASGDWQRDGNQISNSKWNATIVIQSQPQGMIGGEKEFLDSYNDMNVRDAPAWSRGTETMGTLAGMKAARTEGSYNDGGSMKTRDYVFFAPAKTVILQMRIAEEHAAHLAPVIDYTAGSFKPL